MSKLARSCSFLGFSALVFGVQACGGADSTPAPAPAPAPAASPDATLQEMAATYTSFTKINARTFATAQHQGNSQVNVWANGAAAAAYSAIDPSVSPAALPVFAEGSMLVKEMLDANGGEPVLTVMAKRAPGYDPSNGDWWFGRLRRDGTPTSPDLVGKVSFCVACHSGAAKSDHLYGVARANR